jgi:hypothetical protein
MKRDGTLGNQSLLYITRIFSLFFSLIDLIYKGTFYITPENHIFVNDGKTDFAKMLYQTKLFLIERNWFLLFQLV